MFLKALIGFPVSTVPIGEVRAVQIIGAPLIENPTKYMGKLCANPII